MLSNNNILEERRRQIDTLKVFNDNVSEVKPGEEYAIGFNINGHPLKLTVYLDEHFPNEKPRIIVSPLIKHDWIPEPQSGIIQAAPGLLNFTFHSDLGRVVHAIIREFEKCAPPFWPLSSSITETTTPVTVITYGQNRTQPQIVHQTNSLSHQIHSEIPELCNLTLDDLRQLNEDAEYLNDFVDEMKIVQRTQNDLNHLITEVIDAANTNIEQEQYMKELRSRVNEKINEFRINGNMYEKLNQRYKKKSGEFAPQHIKELLQIAASTADTDCDTHIEQFLNGTIDVQTFIDRYRDAKQLSAIRKAKEERLTHQLSEFEKATY